MNFDDWRPIRRNTSAFLRDLEAFVEEFMPWSIVTGYEPQLLLPPAADEELIQAYAERIARRMISGVAVTNARSWRAAASRSLHGRRIYEAMQIEMNGPVGLRAHELIEENAAKIQSLPARMAKRVASYVAAEQQRGVRASVIAQALHNKVPQLAQSHLKMLARTSVGAAETAFTRARAESIGLNWYEWATSEDSRVRPAHKLCSKLLVSWSDAPAPEQLAGERSRLGHYHPGTVPNCRCISLPLIDLNEVRWPHRVYAHGRIEYVGRAEFERWTRTQAA